MKGRGRRVRTTNDFHYHTWTCLQYKCTLTYIICYRSIVLRRGLHRQVIVERRPPMQTARQTDSAHRRDTKGQEAQNTEKVGEITTGEDVDLAAVQDREAKLRQIGVRRKGQRRKHEAS